jgi:rhodanese-related sulfurtransferase
MIQSFLEFSLRHWELWLAFFAILALLLISELHIKLSSAASVSPQQAVFLFNQQNAIFLDVRDPSHFAKEHIASSRHVAWSELKSSTASLPFDTAQSIIIVSDVTPSHYQVARVLKKAGFEKLYYLKGGLLSWKNASLPLSRK